MKTLNLHRVWEIMNKLTTKQNLLEEEGIYVQFLSSNSNYYNKSFEDFLDYYNFSINEWYLVVFNDDGVPYEDYTNQDFNHIPRQILDMSDEELDIWAEGEIKRRKEQERLNKIAEKERIKADIDRLNKQLEKYD
jgi:hypothetical protein